MRLSLASLLVLTLLAAPSQQQVINATLQTPQPLKDLEALVAAVLPRGVERVPFPKIPWLANNLTITGLPKFAFLNSSVTIKGIPTLAWLNSTLTFANNATRPQLVVSNATAKAG
jgi:hypothetical protein